MADIDFEEVRLGTAPTGVGGDVPRTAFGKITRNFNKIKAFFADSSNAASRKVGTESGDVMEVGTGGVLSKNSTVTMAGTEFGGVRAADIAADFFPENHMPSLIRVFSSTSRRIEIVKSGHPSYSKITAVRGVDGEVIGDWQLLLSTANTTTDSNGFIKAASPVIKLFNDKIEKTDHLEIQSTSLEKLGTGKYKLTGAPELSRDGWYIETPKDRNNNIYFTLDYEENNGELIIKTYEPDYSSGRAENGAPVDILEGRFVSLRFAENPELYPEIEDEQE